MGVAESAGAGVGSLQAQDTCEVGADHGRLESRGRLLSFLEHNGDDIVSDVALPFHLEGSTETITKRGPRPMCHSELWTYSMTCCTTEPWAYHIRKATRAAVEPSTHPLQKPLCLPSLLNGSGHSISLLTP